MIRYTPSGVFQIILYFFLDNIKSFDIIKNIKIKCFDILSFMKY